MHELKGQAGVAAGILAVVVAVVAVSNIANLQSSGKFIATSGLVGDWSFDSGDVTDSSPNHNIGETGPGAQIVASTYGKAAELDGIGAYLVIPAHSSLNNLQTFTTSVWFRQTSQTKQQVLVNKPNAHLYIDTEGVLNSYIGAKNCASGVKISTNRWYHAAVSYDGADVKLYLNGDLVKTCQSTGGDTSSSQLYIGADSRPRQFFAGQIDEVKIYNRVLVASEVKELCGAICPTTSPTTQASPTAQAQPPSPTLYWNFDEGSGTIATDSSGTKAAGIAGALWDDGKFGKSLKFDTNKYASLPLPSEITQMRSITFSAWVKSAGSDGIIINAAPSSQAQYGHGAYLSLASGYPEFRKGISGYVDTLRGTKAITDANWHLVTATYDATATSASSNGVIKIYLDGEEIGSKLATSSGIDWQSYGGYPNPSQLYIGAIKTNQEGSGFTVPDSTFFSGSIDEVRIYNTALSGEQVMALKNHVPPPPPTPTPPPPPTPILYWNFDEGSGTTTKDSIANLQGSIDGFAYIGTPPNGVFEHSGPSWVQGKAPMFGNALSFDGRNDYVGGLLLPDSVKTQAITLSAWVQAQGDGVIVAAEPAGADAYGLGAHIAVESGKLVFKKGSSTSSWNRADSNSVIADSNWHHVAATYDGREMKVYLDGSVAGLAQETNEIKWSDVPGSYPNPASLYIGAFRTNNDLGYTYSVSADSQYFKGSIDEVKIFSGAMSADQVKELYNLVPQEPQRTLTIVRTGSGSGTVTSSPSGIDCGTTCAAEFTAGTQITLTSSASAGSTFTGWSGTGVDCPGTGTCTVALTANTAVTAQFVSAATQLDVGFLLAASLKLEVLRAIFDASIKQGNEMIIYWSDPQKGNNPTTANKWRQINDALGTLGSKMAVIQESINREKDNPTQQGVNKIKADINQLNADISGVLASI